MVLAAKGAILAEDEKGFTLNQVNGDLKITKVLTLVPFETAKAATEHLYTIVYQYCVTVYHIYSRSFGIQSM